MLKKRNNWKLGVTKNISLFDQVFSFVFTVFKGQYNILFIFWNSKERKNIEVCFSEYVVETEWQASNHVSTERFQCKLGMIWENGKKRLL